MDPHLAPVVWALRIPGSETLICKVPTQWHRSDPAEVRTGLTARQIAWVGTGLLSSFEGAAKGCSTNGAATHTDCETGQPETLSCLWHCPWSSLRRDTRNVSMRCVLSSQQDSHPSSRYGTRESRHGCVSNDVFTSPAHKVLGLHRRLQTELARNQLARPGTCTGIVAEKPTNQSRGRDLTSRSSSHRRGYASSGEGEARNKAPDAGTHK